MLPPKKQTDPQQRELLQLFRELGAAERQSLLDFAAFLRQRQGEIAETAASMPSEPLPIPRPPEESVVAAIRRLSETYPMLNRDELLHRASDLMSAHVLHGRNAQEVIDDLQQLFEQAYQRYAADKP
jgi:hypothetical protein